MRRHALHLITTGRQKLEEAAAIARRLPSELIDVVHIREKHRTAREIMDWHQALSAALPGTAIYINDRVDAAASVQAVGVQLGYTSVPIETARKLMPAGTHIGCSVHSVAEAREARQNGADYVFFGHIYATASKEGAPPRGVDALAEVVRAAGVPVVAIGGIGPEQTGEVLSAGAAGIAVLSSVFLHADPERQVYRYREALDRYTAR
ncbi:thiamine phosphate synthase [Paenibacillus thalictri]|uniref:Thiamine-phosphate synthase n=1 Tax=Paenibacillus thalictri TaxID=2527873 RepID=A0A4Q9E0S4_9BACL|nr:thiamine phosphate synthase [Paenibacillus thalictri]TBL81151.1 thiamine phosphate synthase [Paenibacillus thalictri]